MSETISADPGGGATPATWRVLLLNDDHTPMAFVVDLLEQLFDMEYDEAVRLMMRVHQEGMAECGVYAEAEAKQKVAAVLAMAREHQHPLQCTMERNAAA